MNHTICEISIGHIHGTDDFLGQNVCQGQRGFSEMGNSHNALIPMGDWCRLEYPQKIEITVAGKGNTSSLQIIYRVKKIIIFCEWGVFCY